MQISQPSAANAVDKRWTRRAAISALGMLLGGTLVGCTATAPPVATATAPPLPPAPVPFDQAVLNAANSVFAAASQAGPNQRLVVIDPLVNGVTGEQSVATQQIQSQLIALAKARYPQLSVQPFTSDTVAKNPYVLVGTFTPVNAQNQPAGDREAFRFCLVMADLSTGKAIAKSVTRALPDAVNATPTPFFRDSPAWTDDANIKSYINTCQATKVGDPLSPVYVNGIVTASIISDAIDAYNAGHYSQALDLYRNASSTPAGKQLRVLNGLYLTETKLGRHGESTDAFGQLVDYGLSNNRLAVKLLFRPGSTAFMSNAPLASDYPMWMQQIATHSAARNACLQVIGNTSKTGSPALNDQLSLARANLVKARLESDQPALRGHITAVGAGDKFPLIGTGADNASDALDRRVEFQPAPACT